MGEAMTNKIEISRELAEARALFEKWHNDFYGPQDKYNPIRSLGFDTFGVGLGYDDPIVQAQFCAFQGALLAAPAVERQEPVAWMRESDPGMCISNGTKTYNLKCGGAPAKGVEGYSVPLYTSPPAPVAAPEKYDDTLLPFLAMMRKELHANSGKGDRLGWLQMDRKTALLEVFYHLGKLHKSVHGNEADGIREYAADVANMCMMLVDVCGCLDKVKELNP